MASMVHKLQRTYQEGWLSSDQDGDGQVSASELMHKYDLDGDGTIDAKELANISATATSQITLNNELLGRVADLEKDALAMHKENGDKEANFRMTLKACDDKRKECQDLRAKMSQMHDRAAQLAQSEQACRNQMAVGQRQVDGLNTVREKMADDNRSLQSEIDKLRLEANERIQEISSGTTAQNRRESEFQQEIQSLTSKYEAVVRDRGELKSREAVREPELQNVRKCYQDTHDKLQRADQEVGLAQRESQTLRRSLAELEESVRVTKDAGDRATAELDEERARARTMTERLAAVNEAKQRADHEIAMLGRTRVELEKHLTTVTEEKTVLTEHVQHQAQEHEKTKHAAGNERAAWESRHEELKQDLDSLATESRRRMRQGDEEKTKLVKDHQENQRTNSERYNNLQVEYRHLNELLQINQAEASKQAAKFEQERVGHEKRLTALQEHNNSAEATLTELQRRTTAEKAELASDHSSLQQNTLSRTAQYVKMLSVIQSDVQRMGAEGTTLRNDHTRALADLRNVVHSMASLQQTLQTPVIEWHADCKRAFLGLVERIQALTRQGEDSKDALITAELQFQEERSKTLMLQEDKSRLSTHLSDVQHKLENNEKHYQEQLRAAQSATHSATELREMIETNLHTTQHDLEEMQKLMRQLQQDNQALNAELGTTQARQAEKVTLLEETLHTLQSRNRTLESEHGAMGTEKDSLRRTLDEHTAEIKRLYAQIKALEENERTSFATHKAEKSKLLRDVASMGDTVRSLRAQAEKTKSVLDAVQERRKQLQEQNIEYKQMMDDLHRRGPPAPAAPFAPAMPGSGANGNTPAFSPTAGSSSGSPNGGSLMPNLKASLAAQQH